MILFIHLATWIKLVNKKVPTVFKILKLTIEVLAVNEKARTRNVFMYAYVAHLYNQGKNVLNSFIPLVERAYDSLNANGSVSFLKLHSTINVLYSVNMPKATLRELLREMERRNKVVFEDKQRLIVNLSTSSVEQKKRAEIETATDNLFVNFSSYLASSHNISLSFEDTKTVVCNYVFKNAYQLAIFVDKNIRPNIDDSEENEYITEFLDFLLSAKSRNSEDYHAFLNIYTGAAQTALLNFRPSNIEELQNEQCHISNVVLDSNFVMRVLDLQTENECQMAIETLNTLKKAGIQNIVLSSSIKEIQTSIKHYLQESEPYTTLTHEFFENQRIKMSGLTAAQQRGVTRTNLFELTKRDVLISRIQALDIEYKDDEDTVVTDDDVNSLVKYKNRYQYGVKQAEHDVKLIEYCKSHRRKNLSSVWEADWWVLTNDIKLTLWNQLNDNSYQECITEAQLSNLLWLKTDKSENDGIVSTVIALASSAFVNPNDLHRFLNILNNYREQAKDNEQVLEYLALVMASDTISTRDIKCSDDELFDVEAFVASKVEEARNERELEKEETIAAKEATARLCREMELNDKKHTLKDKINDLKIEQMGLLADISSYSTSLQNKQSDLDKYAGLEGEFQKEGRKIALQWASIVLIIILAAIIVLYISPLDKFITWLETPIGKVLSTILSAAFVSYIFMFLSTLITGGPKKPKEYFEYMKSTNMRKTMEMMGVTPVTENALSDHLKDLTNEIANLKNELAKNKDKLNNLKIEITVNELSLNELETKNDKFK